MDIKIPNNLTIFINNFTVNILFCSKYAPFRVYFSFCLSVNLFFIRFALMYATNYIKERMSRQGVTYKTLASGLNITDRQVRNWVMKPHRLNFVQLNQLCILLKIKPLRLSGLILDTI